MSNLTKLLILVFIGLFLASASVWFIGGKKREYNIIVTLPARPYQLFPYLTEPEHKMKWMTDIVSESIVPDPTDESNTVGEIQENTELQTVIQIDGEPVSFRGLVLHFARNEVASVKYRSEELNRTSFFRLKGNEDKTQLEYKRVVQLDGMKRFMSVFGEDRNQSEIEAEIQTLTSILKNEVDNSIPDPNQDLSTVGADSETEGSEDSSENNDGEASPLNAGDDNGSNS